MLENTMLENTAETVVAAVADKESEAGLAYVVADLRRRGGRVRLVHVVPAMELLGSSEPMVVEGDTLRRAGSDVVDELAAALGHELPDAPVLTAVLFGPTVPELVGSARGARSIVVQRRPRGWRRVVTLSTANGVAAHASVPVVVVPGEWAPEPSREPVVVVGVDDVLTAPHLLATAFDEAELRHGRLRIVHAWHFDDAYDDLVLVGGAARAFEDELRHDLEREVAPTLRRHPDVAVELVVRHARAADMLTEESESAGLLLLGRHRPTLSWGPHLGSIVRAVLREAACPVMVVDPATAPPARDRTPG
ncbi:universal stress protein [Nocardioides soli]|uniref:Nucleotide-binding universal stress UspA family protein n=1 Tax=Nocardioides soli TaxID=1036020 RepID=A0A7W4VXT8_9ACTN|nr:universal stress protein [Nocardioides soli]MBB3043762.1 nucleotide-binding universal stress UspA family protein [Nocardioides soli]